jgi:hypothetical protein
MEAFAEALAALVEAFVGMTIAAVELLAALLELLLEFAFVLATHGYKAAHQRYGQRKEERRLAREAARKTQEGPVTATPPVSKTRAIVTIVAMLAIVSAGITFYVQNSIRKRKIEETQIQLTSIANDVSQKVRDDVQPLPEIGPLTDRDAWNRQIELSLRDGVLGTRITVRSDGPDEQARTADDIRAYRHVNHSVKEVAGELGRRGIDTLKHKASGFLPDRDESGGKSSKPPP